MTDLFKEQTVEVKGQKIGLMCTVSALSFFLELRGYDSSAPFEESIFKELAKDEETAITPAFLSAYADLLFAFHSTFCDWNNEPITWSQSKCKIGIDLIGYEKLLSFMELNSPEPEPAPKKKKVVERLKKA